MKPWCNGFLREEELGTEPFYPLRVVYCHDCATAQLDYTVAKEIMFGDHTYLSGMTRSLSEHFAYVAGEIDRRFAAPGWEKSVLDIGSNDGTQLKHFQALGYDVLGVESSAQTAAIAQDAGVPTVHAFFNMDLAKQLDRQFGAINAAGVFFHLEELHSVAEGIRESLRDDGVFVVQFLYMKRIVENLAFDQIYHEHLLYYNLRTLDVLLDRHGLAMFDAHLVPIHGGSMIAFVTHAGQRPPSERLTALREEEDAANANAFSTYTDFAQRIEGMKAENLAYLDRARQAGKRVYGMGAPVKGNTLLNYFGIGTDYVEFLVEKNELRRGLFSPGMHIPIILEEEVKEPPDIYYVLAWNFKKEILANHADEVRRGVEFYFPVNPKEVCDGPGVQIKGPSPAKEETSLHWPLMEDNITREDLDEVIAFLQDVPVLTQAGQVRAFEDEWSTWLGVRHSVMVNSGSSANFISMAVIRHLFGGGEVIVPTLTWVSDIASVLAAGLTPVFVDVNPRTLGMDEDQVLSKISPKTRAVFLTHVLGFNALTDRLLGGLRERNILLIEDACESHGTEFRGRKAGTFGLLSNFSFYFAHHMSTIEGGMISTDDAEVCDLVRMLRSHGMVREAASASVREKHERACPDLNPKFIFAYPSGNYRSTEINAVIGRSQLKRLDDSNRLRRRNFELFLQNLDSACFQTDFDLEGSVNYAFVLILREPDTQLRDRVVGVLDTHGIEHRRGTSGGGNQLRQPYLRDMVPAHMPQDFPNVEHVHFFGFYIGNFPQLDEHRILRLCDLLNSA